MRPVSPRDPHAVVARGGEAVTVDEAAHHPITAAGGGEGGTPYAARREWGVGNSERDAENLGDLIRPAIGDRADEVIAPSPPVGMLAADEV